MRDLGEDFGEFALNKICAALQLSAVQFEAAKTAYGAVGAWLGRDGAVAALNPRIYPQGSMALGTTVKPWRGMEYDLDVVVEIDGIDVTPRWLYEAIRDRLADSARYRPMLKEMPKCLRLEYSGQFHLDVVPARTHVQLGSPFIQIPQAPADNSDSHRWTTSNPLEFIRWFEDQCAKARVFLEALRKARQEPLPLPVLAIEKPVLARATQLLKRHRDTIFHGASDSPSSIVLTTLAGHAYQGEPTIVQALTAVSDRVIQITQRDPRLAALENPSTGERLCANWSAAQGQRFAVFVRRFREGLATLQTAQGIQNVAAVLKKLFGEETAAGPDLVSKAVTQYMEEFSRGRERGDVRFTPAGLSTIAGTVIRKHSFYGGEGAD